MFPQEVQEALVLARFHVEETGDNLVVPAGLFEPAAHHVTHLGTGNLARHVHRVDRGPERFPMLGETEIEVVGDGAAALATRAEGDVVLGADLRGQVLQLDGVVLHGHHHALDQVLELADITRPRVRHQRLHGVGRDASDGRAVGRDELAQEVVHQIGHVFAAFAQGRHRDLNHVEAVIEVFPEGALRDHLAQVAVGGADDAHVDVVSAAVGADPLNLASLQEAQQQALHPKGHLANLIQEHRAHVGRFELAGLVTVGAGEAAPDVAEELRFEQRFWQAGAIDGREHHRRAGAAAVDSPRDDLLADAALAGDQHFRIAACHAVDLRLEAGDLGAATDQAHVHLGTDGHWAHELP